ncbi:MAG: hypothetical protein AB1420_12230 [Bacillota bacterium]
MKPKSRMWIDARKEGFQPANVKKETYIIEGIKNEEIKKKLWEAIGFQVLSIEVLPDNSGKVTVTYNDTIISPRFMDYRLHLKGISYKREGD